MFTFLVAWSIIGALICIIWVIWETDESESSDPNWIWYINPQTDRERAAGYAVFWLCTGPAIWAFILACAIIFVVIVSIVGIVIGIIWLIKKTLGGRLKRATFAVINFVPWLIKFPVGWGMDLSYMVCRWGKKLFKIKS